MAIVAVFCVLAVSLVEVQSKPDLIILMTESNNGRIPGSIFVYKLSAHENTLTTLHMSNVTTPVAIDYDNVAMRVYWTDKSNQQVRSADLDGGNDVIVASLDSNAYPEGLAVDADSGKIFYTDWGNKVIVKIKVSDFSSTTIVNRDLDEPRGIAVDTTNKKLYWVDHVLSKIESCNYDGSGRRTVTSNTVKPTGIAVNENTGRLYWSEFNGKINSILIDGTRKKNIVTNQIPAHVSRFMDICLFNGFLYSTESPKRKLYINPEDGGNEMVISIILTGNLTGIHAFSPNSKETGCSDGKYGTGCTDSCGQCRHDTMCEKTVGVCFSGCESGYKPELCTENCTAGLYGEDCESKCNNCKSGSTCDHVTGVCPRGCKSNWKGEKCTDKVCAAGLYGEDCESKCNNCKSGSTCDNVTGVCPSGCKSNWKGEKCTDKGVLSDIKLVLDAANRMNGFTFLPLMSALLLLANWTLPLY